MKQTAVEWLVEQMINQMCIRIKNTTIGVELFEQSKEMEKQQIIEAYYGEAKSTEILDAEQYYNETFKNE